MPDLETELEQELRDYLTDKGFDFDGFRWNREASLLTLVKDGVEVQSIEVFEPKPFFRRNFELRRWGKPFTPADLKDAVESALYTG